MWLQLTDIRCICLDSHLTAQKMEEEVGGINLVADGRDWMDAGERNSAATSWFGGCGRGLP